MSRSPPTITVPQAGRRPSSIAELADRAKEGVCPETRGLRDLLRAADRHWREGKEYLEKGDLDNAYISLARVAPLVLEKLPSHPDYKILLSDTQRHNLALNVQSILDDLINLKYALVDRCDTQLERQPSSVSLGTNTTTPPNPPKPTSLLFSRPFHCPKPNCNKSYKFENGLKYHMAYGACSISLQKSAEHNQPPSSTPASSGSSNHSNPSTTSLPSQASPLFFRCPRPNCNNSYRQATGLQYHLIHGNCAPKEEVDSVTERLAQLLSESPNTSSNTGVGGLNTIQGSLPNSTTSAPLPTALSRFSEARSSETDREAEIRLRPFACGVGDCTRRYKNMNGLKYHYQHSGEHGAEGIALLNSGRHPLLLADGNVGRISRSGTSTQAQQVPIILAPLKKRRRACDSCRSSKIRCDLSLFECSQCQRSGRQCSFGQEERGRSRYRTCRAQSVPDPRKTNIDLPSQLTIFPPPAPFPAGIRNAKTEKANLEQASKPQRARLEAVNVPRPKTSQPGREQGEYKHIVPKSSPPLTPGVSRPRSFSFNRPTERDPNFGRPYSRPSSRPASRASSQLGSSPPSRSSSVHGSPISTSGLWWKSSLEKDPVSEQIKTTSAPNDPKPPSRLAIPLPTPTGSGRRHRGSYRGTVKKDHRRTSTTRSRRYSRPPSPHPSRPTSRSSFSIPLERKSSFSHSSPVPVSGSSSRHSSRPSSRTSYYSPVQYSPNPSPKTSGALYSYFPQSAPASNPQATSTSHKSWSSASSYDVETLFERYSPGPKPVKS